MNYSSSSQISPSGISSDLYPPDLQSLHIQTFITGTGMSLLTCSNLWSVQTIGFSFNQFSSITINQNLTLVDWWGQWPVVPFIVPGSEEIKVRNKKQKHNNRFSHSNHKHILYNEFQYRNWFLPVRIIIIIINSFTKQTNPPRQDQTYISYLMFLIWRK